MSVSQAAAGAAATARGLTTPSSAAATASPDAAAAATSATSEKPGPSAAWLASQRSLKAAAASVWRRSTNSDAYLRRSPSSKGDESRFSDITLAALDPRLISTEYPRRSRDLSLH